MLKQKILVIEDDNILLNNVGEILREENYEVKLEQNGKLGIKTAKSWNPDLIICDISMPVMDGYKVLSEILKSNQTKNIPFIFLTAKVGKDDIRKGMQLGADDYIFKPFTIDDLLTSVKIRLLKKKQAENSQNQSADKINHFELDDKILIKFNNGMQLVFLKDIKYLRAKTPYILIKCRSGKSTLLRDSLDEWERKLPEKTFLRIHRSTIINTDFISKFEKFSNSSYIIRLQDESEPFLISKRYTVKIKNQFGV